MNWFKRIFTKNPTDDSRGQESTGTVAIKLEFLPKESEWTVAEGMHDGSPIITRLNETAAMLYAPHPLLPIRMGIAVPLNGPDPNGFPGEAEQEQLYAIEDRIEELLDQNGRLVLVISTGGMREFISYVADETSVRRTIETLSKETQTHEITAYGEIDKEWEVFQQFRVN